MPIQWSDWPIVPRRALDTVMELLNRAPETGSANGVALIGNEGVGKSTLAAQAADRLGRGEPLWVIGTLTQQAVPFGAFGPLIEVHDVGKPAAMIRSAADSVLAQAGSAPIIIDNARLLDPLSASVVYHLAQEHSSPLIVTVRSVLQAPQVVTALWNDGLLRRMDLDPLDGEETAALVAAAGGSDPTALYRRSAGYPLHLRLLMATGSSEETLTGAVDRYLTVQSAAVRDVLAHLCVFEPLSRADLIALSGEAAVAEAAAAGAVQIRGADVYGGHPLFLERLAAVLDKADVQSLRTAVAAQLATRPCRTPADRLSRNLIALHCDGPFDADSVVEGAQEALLMGDLGLAERLAAGVLQRGDRFDARLTLSNALAWQGRGREADATLAEVDPAALSEEQLMAWALPRAANQFWMLSEPERAVIFLQNVRGRVGSASSRITLDALSGTFAMNAGNVRRALEIADEVLAQPDAPEMAVAWAGSAAALSSARMGHFDHVGRLVDRALGSEYPGLLRFTVGLAQTTTQLMGGQTEAALETARGFTDFAESAQPGRAIGEVLLAHVLLTLGDYEGAAELLQPAAAALERTGYSWGPLALTLLTTALAHQGEIAESAKALSRAQSRHGTKSALFAPELGVARAWRLATIGDRPAAISVARDAARMAQRGGQYAIAVRTWHEATRLGDRRAADAIDSIISHADCAYAQMALAHARALTAGDADALLAAAGELSAAGFAGAARDATDQAQALSGAVR